MLPVHPSRLALVAALSVHLAAVTGCREDAAPLSYDNPLVVPSVVAPAPIVPVTAPSVDPAAAGSVGQVTTESQPAPGSDAGSQPSQESSTADAAQWTEAAGNLAGLESECGNMSLLSVRPDGDELIAGIALQGLWSSTDGGESWTELGDGEGSADIVNRPSAIVYDPDNPETYWEAGLYNEGGLYRTDDGGATFVPVGDVIHTDLVAIDFGDPERQTMLAGRHEAPMLFRSVDGGASWTDISASLPADTGFATAPMIIDADVHLLGTNGANLSGVFRTVDGGETWDEVFAGPIKGAPLRASDGSILWLRDFGQGVIRSVDDGATWTLLPGTGLTQSGAASLIELPDGRLATVGPGQVLVSEDGGGTWVGVGAQLPYEPTGLVYSAAQQAFYIWRFVCEEDQSAPHPIVSNSIMRLDFPLG